MCQTHFKLPFEEKRHRRSTVSTFLPNFTRESHYSLCISSSYNREFGSTAYDRGSGWSQNRSTGGCKNWSKVGVGAVVGTATGAEDGAGGVVSIGTGRDVRFGVVSAIAIACASPLFPFIPSPACKALWGQSQWK
jgi:hypothetical protein